jgi:Ras-related protein Rab-32
LLGNKCDLDDAIIDRQKLDEFCKDKGFIGWFDTSAKLNINIDKAARFLVEEILKHQDIFEKKKKQQTGFQPGKAAPTQQSGGCC